MKKLIEQLYSDGVIRLADKEHPESDLISTYTQEMCRPATALIDGLLSNAVVHALHSMGIYELYAHQAEAIRAALSGQDVVLSAPTASGKTLAYALPVLERMLQRDDTKALVIHPLKALGVDQRKQVEHLYSNVNGLFGNSVPTTWIFDGDTPQDARKIIKNDPPSMIFTNPEMLHMSFCQYSDQWARFLSKLRFIVIDEMHEYRGYFGAQFACIIKRFLAILNSMGVKCQLFLCTATCSNALEHAYNLTNRRCVYVSSGSDIHARRHFIFVNLKTIPSYKQMRVYQYRVSDAVLSCLKLGMRVLCFCQSRKAVEEISKMTRKGALKNGVVDSVDTTIVPYRSGYTAEERREIENNLKAGVCKAVFSTSALELGIDIGCLDVCVLAGFPSSVFSAWQRIGRVGRSFDKDAYILHLAQNNPYDQFYAEHLEEFVNRPVDRIFVGSDNEEIIAKHIPYLLRDVPGPYDASILGNRFAEMANEYAKQGVLSGAIRYQNIDIRGSGGKRYTLVCGKEEIGEISAMHAFKEAYIGAIYVHRGHNYKVITHSAKEIMLEPAPHGLTTRPICYESVRESDTVDGYIWSGHYIVAYAKIDVNKVRSGYVVENEQGEVIERYDEDNIAHNQIVYATRFEFTNTDWAVDDFMTLQYLLGVGVRFVIPCDRYDVDTYCDKKGVIYVYETVPGGIGICKEMLTQWRDVLKYGLTIAEKCDCRNGCPKCIGGAYHKAEKVNKNRATMLGRHILEQTVDVTHSWDSDRLMFMPKSSVL